MPTLHVTLAAAALVTYNNPVTYEPLLQSKHLPTTCKSIAFTSSGNHCVGSRVASSFCWAPSLCLRVLALSLFSLRYGTSAWPSVPRGRGEPHQK